MSEYLVEWHWESRDPPRGGYLWTFFALTPYSRKTVALIRHFASLDGDDDE